MKKRMFWAASILLMQVVFVGKSYTQADTGYFPHLERWHDARMESLKADNGWLNVTGLFWLSEGKNSFGSDKQNAIVFPEGSIAANAGYFERKGNMVNLVVSNAANDFVLNYN